MHSDALLSVSATIYRDKLGKHTMDFTVDFGDNILEKDNIKNCTEMISEYISKEKINSAINSSLCIEKDDENCKIYKEKLTYDKESNFETIDVEEIDTVNLNENFCCSYLEEHIIDLENKKVLEDIGKPFVTFFV